MKQPRVLVIAGDPSLRRTLGETLSGECDPVSIHPRALREPARWVDALAAVAVLDGREKDGLEPLDPLRGLPAGGALVLVLLCVADDLAECALSRLMPGQALTHPTPAPLLRSALRRVLPPLPGGEGARPKQRRAPALLGVSHAIRDVMQQVRQIAPTRVSVLILGETGTGKEIVARAIHEESPRRSRAFVAVNCSALPDALLESELFGYQQGAFTGAERSKSGLLEQADAGTLFLDEIGDTSPALQAKLLRVIESGEVRPLGATRTRQVDVRLIAATHRDLLSAAEEGGFRQDLLYRVNGFTLYLPPLRRRPIDIPFLAQHFAEEFGEEYARRITLADDFVEGLSRHDFPGNVRELRNAVERAIALAAPEETVTARHLSSAVAQAPCLPVQGTLRARLERVEIEAIAEALEKSAGNLTRAAAALGLSRLGLRKKMRRLGLGRR